MTHSIDSPGDFDSQTVSRKFTGLWIAREIYLHKELNALEKMLWVEINSLFCDEKGGCYASEKYLCNFLGIKKTQLYAMLKHLRDLGLVIDVDFNGRQKIRKAVMPKDVKKSCGGQTSGKPECSHPENRTPTNIYKNKEENKELDREPSAPKVAKSVIPEKIIHHPALEEEDIPRGTVKMSQKAWDSLCKDFGEESVLKKAHSLSSKRVTHAKQYGKLTNHAMTLRNWLERDQEEVKKSEKEKKVDWKNPSGIGEASFRPKSIAQRVQEEEEKALLKDKKP